MNLVKKIDIEKFGSFSKFKQDRSIGCDYGKLNIFYGRNYSGKSTFSKIFQSFEFNTIPAHYDEADFTLKSATGELKVADIKNNNLKCRVFNADYIRKNLNFFSEENGISSFVLSVGADNSEFEKFLEQLATQNETLKANNESKQKELNAANVERNNSLSALDKLQQNAAREIKNKANPQIAITSYNKTNFQSEIDPAIKSQFLSDEQIKQNKRTITEEQKQILSKTIFPNIKFIEAQEHVNQLIRKSVVPSQTLKEIENSPQKEQWVKDGLTLHKHEDSGNDGDCAFCGNPIDKERYDLLDAVFSEEVALFEREINNAINRLENIQREISNIEGLVKENFYTKFQSDIKTLNQDISSEKKSELSFVQNLISNLSEKKHSLFKSSMDNTAEVPNGFMEISIKYDDLYDSNKNQSENLDKSKEEAKYSLRLNFIKKELEEKNYSEMIKAHRKAQTIFDTKQQEITEIKKNLIQNEILRKDIETKLSNEKNAAKTINEYLNHFLGHKELTLDILEGTESQSRFQVLRQNAVAHNLSEGEMSLIAFSYYLATLKSIPESELSETIIFVDDPISSLDENNIFYIYSLIYSEIVNINYAQIFITTHNLDFLKYATKLPEKNKQFFLISKERNSNGSWDSKIEKMPKYMSQKVTEFNFLFEQIYTVATETQSDENYSIFYNFPNNARKFLETLLYFKYPNYKIDSNRDLLPRLNRFFGQGENVPFLERINNEYSHGADRFDRLSKQLNSAEFQQDAQLILKTIKKNDRDQYENLLENSALQDIKFI